MPLTPVLLTILLPNRRILRILVRSFETPFNHLAE
jgi:hypothetical protein